MAHDDDFIIGITEGGTPHISGTSYHASGAVSGMSYGNGLIHTHTLNALQQTERLHTYKPGGRNFVHLSYAYGARGLITGMTDGVNGQNSRTYTYDPLGQLASANSGMWGMQTNTYDSLGNIRSRTLGTRTISLSYDGRNRVSQSVDSQAAGTGWGGTGTRTLGYDSRGNVTSLGSLSFLYDYSDQPWTVTGTTNGNYRYDGHLKRVRAQENGQVRYNVYDASGALRFVEHAHSGKSTAYVSGPGGQTVARIDENGDPTYVHPDHLGSVREMSTGSGNNAGWGHYSPFGLEIGSNMPHNEAGFTGHLKDNATGLSYMQARYYDPVMGRFLSIDPVTFTGSGYDPRYFNRYAYAGNDPINNLDPNGEAIGKAIKFVRNTIKHKGNPIKGGAETLSGIADDLGTLVDGQLNLDDAAAVVSLITGLDKKDQAAIGGAAKAAKNALPKPPRGKGSVPKDQRDPKRTFSPSEREAKRAEQGGQCANGCGTDIDASNSQGHHIERHADGGPTTSDNHAEVCIDCHKDLHSPD